MVPSACFPYTAQNRPCNLSPTGTRRLTQISAWETFGDQASMKAFIAQTRPMTACFTVYEDSYYR